MRQGDLEKRFDVAFNNPQTRQVTKFKFPTSPLKDLVISSFSGGTPSSNVPEYWGEELLWVSPKDFSSDVEIHDSEDKISEAGRKAANLKIASVESVLIVVRSGVLKHSLPVVVNSVPLTVNQDVKVLKLNSLIIIPQFFANLLRIRQTQILPKIVKHSTTVQSINTADLDNLLIPLPPLKIQEQLVEQIESARASRCEKLARADALLDGLDAWLLEQLGIEINDQSDKKIFGLNLASLNASRRVDANYYAPKYVQITNALEGSHFHTTALEEICHPPVGGATPKKADTNLYSDVAEGIKFLRIMNINPNAINLEDVKYITQEVHTGELNRSILEEDDVIMTITGRVGTCAVVSKDILPANINQHIVRLKIINKNCLSKYLAIYLNSSMGLTISNREVTGATRIALDYTAIRSIPIPLPPINLQEEIIEHISDIKDQHVSLRFEAETEWQAAKQHFEHQLLETKDA